MARWAPNIVSVASNGEGGVEVQWAVDTFFSDSEEPEKVFIALNGVPFQELGGDETSTEIPADKIAASAPVLTIGVIFWWSGDPPETKQSVVQVPVQSAADTTGGAAVKKPEVTVVHVLPRTRTRPNTIRIHWESHNYNDGNIIWGPDLSNRPGRKSIATKTAHYRGDFDAQPLQSGVVYFFKVEVRNTTQPPAPWHSTTIAVRAAIDTLSVAQFLDESRLGRTTPLATLVGPEKSVRTLVLG